MVIRADHPDPCHYCGRIPRVVTDGARCPLHPEILEHLEPDCPMRFVTYRRNPREAVLAWNGWNEEQRRKEGR